MTELRGIARGLEIDQKTLQQLAAASSLEVNPLSAVTLVSESCSHVYACVRKQFVNLLYYFTHCLLRQLHALYMVYYYSTCLCVLPCSAFSAVWYRHMTDLFYCFTH